MRTVHFAAMGTAVSVTAPAECADDAGALAVELFADWDAALSRFRPDSELSRLNASAGRSVAVSELLYSVLDAALAAARATAGVFDPTLLRDLVRVGYDRTFALLPRNVPAAAAPPIGGGGWRRIFLDPEWRTVRLPPRVAVDLGGIAKGMAVDATLDRLEAELDVDCALVDAGGDLAVRGLPPELDHWPLAVEDLPGIVLPLQRGALATSGGATRRWRQAGRERHHLIDPRTGEPAAPDLRSVTVAAGSCRQAEAAATACFVLGRAGAQELLERHRLAGLLVGEEDVVPVGGWPLPALAA